MMMQTLPDIDLLDIDLSREADAVADMADFYTEAYGMPPNEAYTYALGIMLSHTVGREIGIVEKH